MSHRPLAAQPAARAEPATKKTAARSGSDTAPTVAVVNGTKITAAQLERLARVQQWTESEESGAAPMLTEPQRAALLEQLIDQQLIREFLAKRQTKARPDEVQAQVERIRQLAVRKERTLEQQLAELGHTEATLREELSLPLAWQVHVERTVTPQKLQAYFAAHRPEFDGTLVRASQILIRVETSREHPALAAAEQRLRALRQQLVDRQISFADAAHSTSEAPSREQGGDIGFFPWEGKMPASVSQAAFALKVGEISAPVRSPFGVHLIQVTDRQPGDLSLEDVRERVWARLSRALWQETVAAERKQAKLELVSPAAGTSR